VALLRYAERMVTDTQARMLQRAMQRFAKPSNAASALGISLRELERYVAGEDMPIELLLHLIELVTSPMDQFVVDRSYAKPRGRSKAV
jgi:hypothetical protein